jgi:hypothetical protein
MVAFVSLDETRLTRDGSEVQSGCEGQYEKKMWILGAAGVFLAAMSPMRANAQSGSAEPDMMAQVVTGRPANSGALAPSEVIVRVRSAGFDPLSRPIQRGGVYVLFALDHQYLDVRLTVDAGNGRVLSATRLAGMRYGGPGFDGYEMSPPPAR